MRVRPRPQEKNFSGKTAPASKAFSGFKNELFRTPDKVVDRFCDIIRAHPAET